MTFTELIEKNRKEQKVTHKDLAAAMGLSKPSYYKKRDGEREFTEKEIMAAMRFFGVKVNVFKDLMSIE